MQTMKSISVGCRPKTKAQGGKDALGDCEALLHDGRLDQVALAVAERAEGEERVGAHDEVGPVAEQESAEGRRGRREQGRERRTHCETVSSRTSTLSAPSTACGPDDEGPERVEERAPVGDALATSARATSSESEDEDDGDDEWSETVSAPPGPPRSVDKSVSKSREPICRERDDM